MGLRAGRRPGVVRRRGLRRRAAPRPASRVARRPSTRDRPRGVPTEVAAVTSAPLGADRRARPRRERQRGRRGARPPRRAGRSRARARSTAARRGVATTLAGLGRRPRPASVVYDGSGLSRDVAARRRAPWSTCCGWRRRPSTPSCGPWSAACRSPASPARWSYRFASGEPDGRGLVRAKTGTLTGVSRPGRAGHRRRGPDPGVRRRGRPGRRCATRSPRGTPCDGVAAALAPPADCARPSGSQPLTSNHGRLADSRSRSAPGWRATARPSVPTEARTPSPSCAPVPTARRAWSGTSPGWSPPTARAPVLVVDRPGWIQANADGLRHHHRAAGRQAHREEGPAHRAVPGRRLEGHRRRGRGCSWVSWPARCSASSTRSTPRTAGCCWSRRTSCTSSASSRRTRPTSGSGCACTRRPTGCSSPPSRGCASHLFAEIAGARRHRRAQRADRRPGQADRRGGPGRRLSGGSLIDVLGHARSRRRSSTGSPG